MGQPIRQGGFGGTNASGLSHCHGVSRHPVARMRDKIPAYATARHEQPIDIARDQRPEWHVVRPRPVRLGLYDLRFCRVSRVYVNPHRDPADGILEPRAMEDILPSHLISSANPPPFPNADLRAC